MPTYTITPPAEARAIIHPALVGKLTPIEGGRLTCNELGVWTLVRRASCPNADVLKLLPKPGTSDWLGVFKTLYLDPRGIDVAEGKVETILTLTYKGAIGGAFGPPQIVPRTVLQSGSFPLTTAAFDAGTYPAITDQNQPISCSYYSTQITYRWASLTVPNSPTSTSGGSGGAVPFNMSPVSVASGDLSYKSVTQVTDMESVPEAAHFLNTATVAVLLVAKNVDMIDGGAGEGGGE